VCLYLASLDLRFQGHDWPFPVHEFCSAFIGIVSLAADFLASELISLIDSFIFGNLIILKKQELLLSFSSPSVLFDCRANYFITGINYFALCFKLTNPIG
jgi:hypothetical protein